MGCQFSSSPGSEIAQAALQGQLILLRRLLIKYQAQKNHDRSHVSYRDAYGWSALHMASLMGNSKVMELLIDCQWEVDAKNNEGQTPLYVAADHLQEKACLLLLRAGAEPKFVQGRLQNLYLKPIIAAFEDEKLSHEEREEKRIQAQKKSSKKMTRPKKSVSYVNLGGLFPSSSETPQLTPRDLLLTERAASEPAIHQSETLVMPFDNTKEDG